MTGKHIDLPGKSTGAAAAARDASLRYLATPALPDVLHEQVDFLVAHASHNIPGCAECLRLTQVVRILMRPFE
jgi:hypothetical protein